MYLFIYNNNYRLVLTYYNQAQLEETLGDLSSGPGLSKGSGRIPV